MEYNSGCFYFTIYMKMKKQINLLLLLVLMVFIATSCSQNKLEDGTYNFDVYATNDLHGRFFDSLYVSNNGHQTDRKSVV